MWQERSIAFCVLWVLEGVLPFLSPQRWRGALTQLLQLSNTQLRLMGLASMLLGTSLLYLLHRRLAAEVERGIAKWQR